VVADVLKCALHNLPDSRGNADPQAAPLDLLRNIKRLNDHPVAGAVYPGWRRPAS
jgi:hypothetical protein